MKKNNNRKGFTLIELLVVITIIGILAVGGISGYTNYIKGARDSSRITNMGALRTALIGYSTAKYAFPDKATTFKSEMPTYLEGGFPSDPKIGSACASNDSATSFCGYVYKVEDSSEGIDNGAMELSVAFESKGEAEKTASNVKDGGDDEARYEIASGKKASEINTAVNKKIESTATEASDAAIFGIQGDKMLTVSTS